jgi:hypothetical protein
VYSQSESVLGADDDGASSVLFADLGTPLTPEGEKEVDWAGLDTSKPSGGMTTTSKRVKFVDSDSLSESDKADVADKVAYRAPSLWSNAITLWWCELLLSLVPVACRAPRRLSPAPSAQCAPPSSLSGRCRYWMTSWVLTARVSPRLGKPKAEVVTCFCSVGAARYTGDNSMRRLWLRDTNLTDPA